MKQQLLKYNGGFKWTFDGNISFKGYLYDADGLFKEGADAASLFEGIKTAGTLREMLQQTDGAFTVIVETQNSILVGVDAMSMFSIYYSWNNNQWLLSDSALELSSHLPHKGFQYDALPEFLSAGFVTGSECLIKDIHKTQAGEVLSLKNDGTIDRSFHYHFLPVRFTSQPVRILKNQMQNMLDTISKRLLGSLNGQTAVIPLSGGYDSRLLAAMLKKAGYEKVVCFSYGKPNQESILSEKVARQLGYQWIFTDYRHTDPASFVYDKEFARYCDYTGNATSMPFLQEYFAIKQLRESGAVPPGSIFLPGHTGDYIAGSYTEKTIRNWLFDGSRSKVLARKYFRFVPLSPHDFRHIAARIDQWFSAATYPDFTTDPDYDVLKEDWDLKEKFSKFVFNAAKVFPCFDYPFRLPLWDKPFREYFRSLPFTYRSYKRLYNEVTEEDYFKPLGIYYGREELKEKPHNIWIQRVRSLLRPILPHSVRKKRMVERDYLMYHVFTKELINDAVRNRHIETPVPTRFNHFNALICYWYANQVRKWCDQHSQSAHQSNPHNANLDKKME